MIPLRDINPRYSTPFVTILLIAANIAVFVYQFSLGPRTGESFLFTYGMVPSRFTIALEAANADYETRIFGPNRVKVQGRLTGLMRTY